MCGCDNRFLGGGVKVGMLKESVQGEEETSQGLADEQEENNCHLMVEAI